MSQPPSPVYILRGHTSQVNTLCWLDHNKYICSGDVEGNLILWDVETKRPKRQWQAHKESVLSVQAIDTTTIVSQGRDNYIHVWNIDDDQPRNSLLYNSVTFCKIALCTHDNQLLVALPSHMDPSQVDIYDLLKQRRLVADIGQEEIGTDSRDTVMTLQMYIRDDHVQLLSGYESGRMVLRIISGDKADTVWVTKRHSSPVLSVSARPDMNLLYSVCTDGVVVKSPLFEQDPAATKQIHTKSGLEQICVRDDAKIIATAGWDNRIRVFSAKTLKPLAVLSFHRESMYAVAFSSLPSDHHYLVGGSKDHRISMWNIY